MHKVHDILDLVLKLAAVILLGLFLLSQINFVNNTKITYDTLKNIKPDAVIDDYTLLDEGATGKFQQDITEKLFKDNHLIQMPFGLVFNKQATAKKEITILIESGGGYYNLGKNIVLGLDGLRKQGFKITCYVEKAMSMAFHILLTSCDERIGTKNVDLMMHRVRIGELGRFTSSTKSTDLEMNYLEALSIGISEEAWLELTRQEDDKYFTKKEMKKYKLIHRFIK